MRRRDTRSKLTTRVNHELVDHGSSETSHTHIHIQCEKKGHRLVVSRDSMASNTTSGCEQSSGAAASGDAWRILLEQAQQGIDPKDRKDWDEFIKEANKIRILVTGATGVGKSTLLNGLIGKKFFKTGDGLERVTDKVTKYSFHEKGVEIIVFDSPGLHDGLGADKESKYVQEMLKMIKAHGGLDLILYCKQMIATDAEVGVEKDIIQKLTNGLGKLKDDRGRRDCIGKDIWHRSLFVLTFTNVYEKNLQCHDQSPPKIEAEVNRRIKEWKDLYKDALNRCGIHIPVRVCVAGYLDPKLCVSEHWLSDLWAAVFETMAESGALALLRLNQHRIVESAEPATDGGFQTPENQPIVLTKKLKSALLPKVAGLSAAGAAGAATGAAIGATIGAIGIGVISFGPAAGAGLAIGGIVGGIIGASVGGAILKVYQRRRAKKEEESKGTD